MDSERTTVTLDRAMARRLTAEARVRGRSVSAVVPEALESISRTKRSRNCLALRGLEIQAIPTPSEKAEKILSRRFRRR